MGGRNEVGMTMAGEGGEGGTNFSCRIDFRIPAIFYWTGHIAAGKVKGYTIQWRVEVGLRGGGGGGWWEVSTY